MIHNGQKLKEMSQRRHVTQETLSKRSKIHQQAISRVFKSPNPSLDKFVKIMEAMELEPFEYWIPKESRLAALNLSDDILDFAVTVSKLKSEFKEVIIDLTFQLSALQGTKTA